MKVHENPFNGSRAVSGIQRDGANLIGALQGCESTETMDYK
jgi:hypothetical protein